MILPKPLSCSGCALYERGRGYVPASGPVTAPILLVGEAAGEQEVLQAAPFVGPAGAMLNRILGRNDYVREDYRIDNAVRCQPSGNWLEGAPWERPAIQHCSQYLDQTLAEGHTVVVPMGGVALKRVLQLGGKGVKVQDFHGTVSRDPTDRFWIVPTFHPSFVQRDATNLIGTVSFDLRRAHTVARDGYTRLPATLVCDPPLDWFTAWVDGYTESLRADPEGIWLSVDLETPDKEGGKDEGKLSNEDRSFVITRINLCCRPDEAVTVPFVGPYIPLVARALAAGGTLLFWHEDYDVPRLIASGVVSEAERYAYYARIWDLMWLWHLLQSDLPRGLGFVAPFYSDYGPWKHLAKSDPVTYACIDGLQTHRIGQGLIADALDQGFWPVFERHICDLSRLALKPAQEVGVGIDLDALAAFKADLEVKARTRLHRLQGIVPEPLRPLTPKHGLKHPPPEGAVHVRGTALTRKGTPRKTKLAEPIKQELYAQTSVLLEKLVIKEVWVCASCQAIDLHKKHRCQDKTLLPNLSFQPASVTRYFWQEPFNPDSPIQVLAYMKAMKHPIGKARKTHKETTDRDTLKANAKTTHDPFYETLLEYRAIGKVKNTYVEGTYRRLGPDHRVHPTPTFRPSTQRLSYVNPNITNVVTDRGGSASLAAGYRRCLVAAPACRLLEVDFSGIEAVETGWWAHDPDFIRLAWLGVHAGLASHLLERPYDPSWSAEAKGIYFRAIKKDEPVIYDRAKHVIHGYHYGLTAYGLMELYPDQFPTLKAARECIAIYESMAPSVPRFQREVREQADRHGYLGGPGVHPFGYRHWFWSIFAYLRLKEMQRIRLERKYRAIGKRPPIHTAHGVTYKVSLGEDAKRAVAFYPQSTAAGVLKEVMLALFDPDHPSYIGDAYFGQTPLRAPIHDSLLLEVPERQWDRVCEAVYREMLRPIEEQPCPEEWGIGSHLRIGISAKASALGGNWEEMNEIAVPTPKELGVETVSQDARVYTPPEDEEQEDVEELGVVA